MAKRKTILELQSVSKTYQIGPSKVEAIKDLNLKIQEGEFISIVGPSGSGKSTLLKLMSGLLSPTSGKIIFQSDQHLEKLSDAKISRLRNRSFGFIFQNFNLLENLTLVENISLPLHISGHRVKPRTTPKQILKRLHIDQRAHHLPSQVSGGQKQRAAIARALIMNPKIIFADEPTGNLDSHTGQSIIQLLQEIHHQTGTTLIIITHDHHIAEIAPRVIEIIDGQISTKPAKHSKIYAN